MLDAASITDDGPVKLNSADANVCKTASYISLRGSEIVELRYSIRVSLKVRVS